MCASERNVIIPTPPTQPCPCVNVCKNSEFHRVINDAGTSSKKLCTRNWKGASTNFLEAVGSMPVPNLRGRPSLIWFFQCLKPSNKFHHHWWFATFWGNYPPGVRSAHHSGPSQLRGDPQRQKRGGNASWAPTRRLEKCISNLDMRHGTCPDFQPSLLVDDGHWWPSFKRSKRVHVPQRFMKYYELLQFDVGEDHSDAFFGLIVQDGPRWRWALKSGELTSGNENSDFYRFLPPKFGMKHRWTQSQQ